MTSGIWQEFDEVLVMNVVFMKSLSFIPLLCILLVSCGGGGGGGSEDGGSSNTPEQNSQEDSPLDNETSPPEPSKNSINIQSSCPSIDSNEALATNSHFHFVFDEEITPSILEELEMKVECDGTELQGTYQITQSELSFLPEENLIPGSSCTITISKFENEIYFFNGLVKNINVGVEEAFDVAFDEPIILENDWPIITPLEIKVLDDTLAIFYSIGASLYVVVSYDGGQTFPTRQMFLDGIIGSIINLTVREYNGELYFTWQVIISNMSTELFYARSTNGLTAFTEPSLLTDLYDPMRVNSHDISVLDNNNIMVAWQDACLPDYAFCGWDATYLFQISTLPGGDAVVSYEELAGVGTERVNLFGFSSSLYVSYVEVTPPESTEMANIENLRIFDFSNSSREEMLTERYQSPYLYGWLEPNSPLYLQNDTVFFSWSERFGPVNRDFFYRTYHHGDENFSDREILFSDDRDGFVNVINKFVSNGETTVGWIEGKQTVEKQIGRFKLHTLDVAKDQRREYQLENLGTSDYRDVVRTYRPIFAFNGNDEFNFLWAVDDETGEDEWNSNPINQGPFKKYSLYLSKAKLVPPCTKN
ncbi:MAG: hypothetical protein VYA55_15650 [Pseudomonadota bacterium]|nr:hypothetical protein [Pseudomonadota bacterium]